MAQRKQPQLDFTAPARPAAAAPALSTPLGRRPQLASAGDLAEAVRCIAWLDNRQQTIEAERDRELARINDAAARELHVNVEGEALTFELWRAELVESIETYLPDHKADVFTGETQTARFAAGQVSYKAKAATVTLAEGVKADDVVERLKKRHKLADAFEKLLERTGLTGWLRVKVELDLQSIQRRHKDGQLKKRDLPAGLTVTEAGETIQIKPFAVPDRADTAA